MRDPLYSLAPKNDHSTRSCSRNGLFPRPNLKKASREFRDRREKWIRQRGSEVAAVSDPLRGALLISGFLRISNWSNADATGQDATGHVISRWDEMRNFSTPAPRRDACSETPPLRRLFDSKIRDSTHLRSVGHRFSATFRKSPNFQTFIFSVVTFSHRKAAHGAC